MKGFEDNEIELYKWILKMSIEEVAVTDAFRVEALRYLKMPQLLIIQPSCELNPSLLVSLNQASSHHLVSSILCSDTTYYSAFLKVFNLTTSAEPRLAIVTTSDILYLHQSPGQDKASISEFISSFKIN